MAKKTSVHLRVYKGAEILKREDGSIKNENWLVKIDYGSAQWMNFLKNIPNNGYGKIEVERVIEVENVLEENGTFRGKEKVTEVKDIEKYKKEVKIASKGAEKPLTKEQQRIKELEERLAKLEGDSDKKESKPKSEKKDDNTKSDDSSDDISALREEYKKLNPEGKGASPKWKADVLKQKIEEFKSKS